MTVSLTPANSADSASLALILGAWIAETDWMPTLHTAGENTAFVDWSIHRHDVTVARAEGVPQGFIALNRNEITLLSVARSYRGRGIGKALLEHAKRQTSSLTLWSFEANMLARRFYVRESFREVARSDGWRNEEKLPDILYSWTRAEQSS